MTRLALLFVLSLSVALFAQQQDRPKTAAGMLAHMWSANRAEGDGPVKLTNFPLRLKDIQQIRPLGLTVGGHVTPSDHLYLIPKPAADRNTKYDVLAVAPGHIVNIQWRPKGNPDPSAFDRERDYKLIIEHSKTVWSYVDHLGEVDPAILKIAGDVQPGQPVQLRAPVAAGQVIGKVVIQPNNSATFDFALIDTAVTRKNFVRPEQFLARDPWKLHTVDPFDYLADAALRDKLLALNPRTAAPRGGVIDYDIDGKLVGNWFRKDTGGYAGLNRRLDYWVGHLSIVYHYIDPTQILISTGDFAGKTRQFQVRNNAPDPAKISKADGLIAYDLVRPHLDGSGRPMQNPDPATHGTLLLQMIGDRELHVEFFPNKSPDQAKAFTKDAQIYER